MTVSIIKQLDCFLRLFWKVSIVHLENFQAYSGAGTFCGQGSIVCVEQACLEVKMWMNTNAGCSGSPVPKKDSRICFI